MHKFLSMYLFLFITLCMFRAHRAHYQERHNKTSGKCHSVLVAVSCAHDTATNTGNQQIITTKQVYHQPANDTTTNTE